MRRLVLLLALASCGEQAPPPDPAPQDGVEGVVATVNGEPITEADIALVLARGGHRGDEVDTPERRKNALDALVRRELRRQEAVRLGLEAGASIQERRAQLQAQLDALERDVLADLYFKQRLSQITAVSDDEARAWFEANQELVRTESHLLQILIKDEQAIRGAHTRIQGGVPFEEVAAERFADLKLPQGGQRPWDLGYLHWSQIPETWVEPLAALAPGDVSDVIRGPNRRWWILKLVDRRLRDGVTFEEVNEAVVDGLGRRKAEEAIQSIDAELRAKADIR